MGDMHQFAYEAKPLILVAVALLAIIQTDDPASLFAISGYVLLAVGLWIFAVRVRYRRLAKRPKNSPSDF